MIFVSGQKRRVIAGDNFQIAPVPIKSDTVGVAENTHRIHLRRRWPKPFHSDPTDDLASPPRRNLDLCPIPNRIQLLTAAVVEAERSAVFNRTSTHDRSRQRTPFLPIRPARWNRHDVPDTISGRPEPVSEYSSSRRDLRTLTRLRIPIRFSDQ